jgi:oxidoreductase
MCLAGKLGSEGLPSAAKATQEGNDAKFTVINNAGALKLAEMNE